MWLISTHSVEPFVTNARQKRAERIPRIRVVGGSDALELQGAA